MANSYGQFTGWVSVSYVVKSEPSCTSHKPSASYQRWLVRGDLVHGICPHAATQSYMYVVVETSASGFYNFFVFSVTFDKTYGMPISPSAEISP